LLKPFHLAAAVGAIAALGGFAVASANSLPPPRPAFDQLRLPVGRAVPWQPVNMRYTRAYWQPVNQAPPFAANGAGTALLLTDGTVMVHDNFANWYKLTPDAFGSYINGTWSQAASLPAGYAPLYYASAVLPDGRIVINGGEYNFGRTAETTLGAIYDPVANAWTSLAPPPHWQAIGDAQSVVLANGTYMLGNCCTKRQALLDARTLTWHTVGRGKADTNSEESWTLLADGSVLAADVGLPLQSERYVPSARMWSTAGNTVTNLVAFYEIGSQVLRPNGTVFVSGASGNTAIYDSTSATWAPGPSFPNSPQQLDVADGPGALLPDGNVLVVASPGAYQSPSSFFEFDGTNLIPVAQTPNAPNDPSFAFRFLVLPNGQMLSTDGSNDVEVYTHVGRPNPAWAPTISAVPTSLVHGRSYVVAGVHLNGLSQSSFYGDDASEATNYPLVRITNARTHHVFYARTHDHSSMAVAYPGTVRTHFDVPATIETGAARLVVVANGIASMPVSVTIH
jgi:hypothetical protein